MGKLAEALQHPSELLPLLSLALAAKRARLAVPKEPSLAFCYDILNRVSRSFAVVIHQLPAGLRDAVCIFYLVLRALDTVEDDTSIPYDVKVPLLRGFHEKCHDRWAAPSARPGTAGNCGSVSPQELAAELWERGLPPPPGELPTGDRGACTWGHRTDASQRSPHHLSLVRQAFLGLDKHYQDVIVDICDKMGNGMADFVPKDICSSEVRGRTTCLGDAADMLAVFLCRLSPLQIIIYIVIMWQGWLGWACHRSVLEWPNKHACDVTELM